MNINVSMICLVTMSIGSSNPYTETSDGVAVQRVSDMGGKDSFLPRNVTMRFLLQYMSQFRWAMMAAGAFKPVVIQLIHQV
jgi:hypothetical protein